VALAPRSRQIITPPPHHSVFFTGRMPFLSPNQQRQSTEGTRVHSSIMIIKHCSDIASNVQFVHQFSAQTASSRVLCELAVSLNVAA